MTATRSSSGWRRWTSGKAELTCCVRSRPGQLGPVVAGGHHRPDDDPLAAGHGRPAGGTGRDPGGHGGHQRLLEGGYSLLEAHGFEPWLVNARDVKHLPGRPKTDTLDAVWLCKLAERQMLRPSFVPHDRSGSCGT
jgi:transposase